MTKDRYFYIKHVVDLSTQDIVNGIRTGIVTFKELQETGRVSLDKQKQVKELLAKYETEDNDFKEAKTLPLLNDYLKKYPNSEHIGKVKEKIEQKEDEKRKEQQEKINSIKRNINEHTPDELKKDFGESFLQNLCVELGIDYKIVSNYDEPHLDFNDIIPKDEKEIPKNYTDVFFWGIPSSGKTCALSVILNTINSNYTMDSPDTEKKFGTTYRDSLVELFSNDTGYLPASTRLDRTQYMPFLLKDRKEKHYRKISFFELSGEVFKYLYEVVNKNAPKVIPPIQEGASEDNLTEEQKKERQKLVAFQTLNLLLNSNNQKIHFFFIDYNQATHKRVEQAKYLNAAATYFRDINDIFKKKTDAVYVVVTKADEIKGENKTEIANQFLKQNFGSFMDVIQNRCEIDSVNFNVKIFSIGDVSFSKICKVNRKYAQNIIEELLVLVKPFKEDSRLKKTLKS